MFHADVNVTTKRLTTGKSRLLHAPGIKFIGKQLIYKSPVQFCLKMDFCEYVKFGDNFVKIWYFVNNCLIKVRIWMCDTYHYQL